MAQLSKYLRSLEGGRLAYWCQGCEGLHQVAVGEGDGPRWGYNGNVESPTFTPSVLVTWDEPTNLHNPEKMQLDLAEAQRRREAGEQNVRVPVSGKICHTFITDGIVSFLPDCTHRMAGMTLPLPVLPGEWCEEPQNV